LHKKKIEKAVIYWFVEHRRLFEQMISTPNSA